MPDIPSLHTFANGTVIDAVEANENNADIRDTFNGSIGSVLADSGQTPGRLVIVNNTGAPAYQAMSGDMTISDTGVATLSAAAQASIGIGAAQRGKSIIATEEARTNTAYGTLTTPDQVTGIVLPTDGLIFVAYQALIKNSVASAARAAVFIGANQVKIGTDTAAAPEVQEAIGSGSINSYAHLATSGYGLGVMHGGAGSVVTTGQIVGAADTAAVAEAVIGTQGAGGPVAIFAAAGTYTISVQFKASSGSVTAKERRLWVWTMGF